MLNLWGESWFIWALVVAVGLPVLLVILTEVLSSLSRRGSAAAKPVRLLRNFVIPVAALFALLTFASQQKFELTWVRVVGTVLGFLLILLVLSAFNVALFANAREGTWRERIPSIFVDLARLALILIGLAILFSWVWNADIGGLIAALGVTSIVIGLALQNAVGSIISGLLLLFEQPFKLGDWLDTGSVRGRVIEVNWRAVHIDTGNGTQIVPNATLAGASFTNLSQPAGLFAASTTVKFTTDDPPYDVIRMLVDVAEELPMLDPKDSPSAQYLGNAAFSVTLPVIGPAVEGEAIALYLSWLWYASRRRGFALDGDATDPVQTPERMTEALSLLAPTLHLREEDFAAIAPACRLEQYGPGETIHKAGVVPQSLRFIVSGKVHLVVPAEGGLLRFQTLEPGEYFNQDALTRQATLAAAISDGTTTVLRVEAKTIDELVRTRPQLAREIGQSIEIKRKRAADALAGVGLVRAAVTS
jgi:small-conductance mechanosensitive channel/CRP-like cAMP-binding protein